MADQDNTGESKPLPKARVARKSWFGWIWLVPLFAAGFVGWLLYRDHVQRGPRIHVQFKNAQGLEPGKSELHFRGARIGLVTRLLLSTNLETVDIQIDLIKSAEGIARRGSTFWIVQPEVSAEKIRGLRAIVSGDYVEVKPGGGEKEKNFVGMEEAPVITQERRGLRVVLLNPKAGSVQRGSPVYYRGVQVGEVTAFELTRDAQAVRVSALVDERFAPLVRDNTRFWNAGGIQVSIGLFSGANIRAESVKSLIAGGIAFATPDPPGPRVKEGTAFRLYDKAEEQWERWAPVLPLPGEKTPIQGVETPDALMDAIR